MELRLAVEQRPGATVVHVDGRLAVERVEELERLVAGIPVPLVLDLSYLVSVDDAGIAELRSLARRGVGLVGASPYVALLLGGAADGATGAGSERG